MASRKIKGTHHVRRKLKTRSKVLIGAITATLAIFSLALVSKNIDSDRYSVKTVVSRIENIFSAAAAPGEVVKINTTATTAEDGTKLGYVNGGGTLINTAGSGNTLTLKATKNGDNILSGWSVNGVIIGGTAGLEELKVCINTGAHDKQYYDSTNKILYVTDDADIEAVFSAPMMGAANGSGIDLIITPNTGNAWIDGGPGSWNGFIHLDSDWYGKNASLTLQYLDGGATRAYVYDENLNQISTETGHVKDTADCYVKFTVPSSAQTIYCIPRLNQTDNSSFAIFESSPEGYGSAGGTPSSGNAPFTTQLQATPNKGYKFKNWTVYHDGGLVETLTEKNTTYYVDGVYKFVANFEEAYWDIKVTETKPDEGCGSITGLGSVKEGTNQEITIVPNTDKGYELDNWSYTTTDGIVHSGTNPTFTIPDIKEDISLYITFKSNKKRIDVKNSPANGGKATIENTTDSKGAKIDFEEFAPGDKAVLKPNPATGYNFLYWKNTAGTEIKPGITAGCDSDGTYTIGSVSSDDTYTAYFVSNALNIKTAVNDSAAGKLKIKYTNTSGKPAESEKLGDHKDVQSNQMIELTATANAGYHFVEFIDSKGNHYSANPLTRAAEEVLEDETYTAVFTGETFSITLKSEPPLADLNFKIDGSEHTSKSENLAFSEIEKHTIDIDTAGTGYKFLYWEDTKGNPQSNDVHALSVPSNQGDLVYTACLVKEKVKVTIDVAPGTTTGTIALLTPAGDGTNYGTKQVFSDVEGNSAITLKLEGGASQEPVEVIDEDGKSYTLEADGTVIIPNINKDKYFTAYFKDITKKVEVIADPSYGGSVTVNGKYGSDEVKLNEKATLVATPALGYIFDGWYTDPSYGGSPIDEKTTYTTGPITDNAKYYAHFVKKTLDVSISVIDTLGTGSVRLYGYNERITSEKTYQVDGSSTITVEAYPDNAGKFDKWVDINSGNTYADNPLTIVNLQKDISLAAVFVAQQSKISVEMDPSDGSGGSVVIKSGENVSFNELPIDNGDPAILTATPKEGYTFLYWTDSRGAQYTGRIGMDGGSTLTINNVYKSETYTAHFVKKDLTILLESTPAGSGMVRLGTNPFSDGKVQYHVQGNSSIEISAQPKDPKKYQFERWENKNDPSEVYTTNPLTIVSVSKTMHFVAVFSPIDIGIIVEAMPASGGQVTKTYNSDGSVVITAIPRNGYTFVNWKKGDIVLTMSPKYTIAAEDVRDGDVYTAYFKEDGTYDARTDITKENFYREWRKISDPNYTITRETMQQQAYSVVAGLRQYDNSTPALRNYAAFSTARAYYESQLNDYDVKRLNSLFGNSELITAEGEILHPDLLPDYERYEEKAEAFTFKKFGKKYETEILTVKRIFEPEEFDNKKRTYLWRYTGALDKDNIYLLYSIDSEKELWATPIVDEDGVLKFTIDELKDNDVVAVVRVKVK